MTFDLKSNKISEMKTEIFGRESHVMIKLNQYEIMIGFG